MELELSELILVNLVKSDNFLRQVIPFIKPEYFGKKANRLIFEIIEKHVLDYNVAPQPEVLFIEIDKVKETSQGIIEDATALVKVIAETEVATNEQWLIDQAEGFCQDQALYNALLTSIQITENKKEVQGLAKGAIPQLFQDALGVSFDTSIGHNLFDDASARYDKYHLKSEKIKFDLKYFNIVTNGGVEPGTLNLLAAGTGVGKSLTMCHMSAANLLDGKNVLYITLEMSEEKITERIEANLLDIAINDISLLPKDVYLKKIIKLKNKIVGNLIVREYPTTCAGSSHFRHLLNELKQKKNFVPDIIYIDYINLCMSSRLKYTGVNSYNYIKSVAEELRGLAMEVNLPIWSATQLNRTGFSNSDAGVEHTSDSFGLPMTADFMVILLQSEEMEKLNQILVKQTTKNRYGDPAKYKRFIVGVDKSKMRLYDIEQAAQEEIEHDDDSSVFDNSSSGERINDEGKKHKFNRKAFENFK